MIKNLNCAGNLIPLERPKILGVLNLTPDSFYDGGKFDSKKEALNQCEKMLDQGADFIDLGAYSSRPGAPYVSEKEEIKRLMPILEQLLKKFPKALFSIDTFRASVARESLMAGAVMINDITAGFGDEDMLETVAQFNAPYIAMHMKGRPETMQQNPTYENIMDEIIYFFSERIEACTSAGIHDVVIDPGFGFGKSIAHNYTLLGHFEDFQQFDVPVLAGVSRKSMIYKVLDTSPEKALNGTTALHAVALLKKAQFLRVHDVKEAKECIQLIEQLL